MPLHERSGAQLHRFLGDIGVPPDPDPMDFSARLEVYLGGRWYTFDARHNTPRVGRILMARGRDATDAAIVTSFGPCTLASFKVTTEEVICAALASGCLYLRHTAHKNGGSRVKEVASELLLGRN
jgi:hypothetical protein